MYLKGRYKMYYLVEKGHQNKDRIADSSKYDFNFNIF